MKVGGGGGGGEQVDVAKNYYEIDVPLTVAKTTKEDNDMIIM